MSNLFYEVNTFSITAAMVLESKIIARPITAYKSSFFACSIIGSKRKRIIILLRVRISPAAQFLFSKNKIKKEHSRYEGALFYY